MVEYFFLQRYDDRYHRAPLEKPNVCATSNVCAAYLYMYADVYVLACMCVYTYVCVYVCMYMRMYIHTHCDICILTNTTGCLYRRANVSAIFIHVCVC